MVTTQRLDVAEALLAKARSTPFAHERQTFAAGALGQIDAYLRAAGRATGTAALDSDRAGTGSPAAGRPQPAAAGHSWPKRGRIIRARSEPDRTVTARAAYRASATAVRPGTIVDLTL